MIPEIDYFKGVLHVEQETDSSKMFISDDEESLFYRVPRRILSYIDGCPSKVTHIEISFDEEGERLIFCATEIEEEKLRFTVATQVDKIIKMLESEGISRKNEDCLYSIRNR